MGMSLNVLERFFLPKDYAVESLEGLQPYLDKLLKWKIDTADDFKTFLKALSELEIVVSENMSWRQIKTTCDTQDGEAQKNLEYFFIHLQPALQVFGDKINKKIMSCEWRRTLGKDYEVWLKNIEKNILLFDEENVPILSELSVLQQDYGNISGGMFVEMEGKKMTLQQASLVLKEKDRDKRREAYFKIQERRMADKDKLNELFGVLVKKRDKVAKRVGFKNYAEYKFKELGRYDYGVEDCFKFHEGIKKHIVPLVNELYKKKKEGLGVGVLKPWDLDAPFEHEASLEPFKTGRELIDKSIICLERVDGYFGECVREMDRLKRLDVESRLGKAPGGYNCPLLETGVPFIFMNAVGTLDDVITMVHEGGHAVHSFLTHDLNFSGFKDYPMEIAELASMSMELFTLNEWGVFFGDGVGLKRAKLLQWERVLTIFPWIAMIDQFQHWVYGNPEHSVAERLAYWEGLYNDFMSAEIDVSETKKFIPYSWQKQLHLYEVPFYYIEYGIAQLGAIGMYKQFKDNKELCLKQYREALSAGGKWGLKTLYERAGIGLRFDSEYIAEMMMFVKKEIEGIENEL